MSNKSEPHRKFVQTFVLAEQPNGYFVLNDIFRYLNNDEDEIIEDEAAHEEAHVAEPEATPAEPAEAAAAIEDPPAEETVDNEAAAEEVDAKLEETIEQPAEKEAEINGADAGVVREAPKVEDALDETEALEDESQADTTVEPTPEPTPEQPAEQEQEPEQQPAEESEPQVAPAQSPPKPAASAPVEAPPAKKTWASLVGSGNKAPAVPALPASTPAPAQPKAPRSAQATSAPKTTTEPAAAPDSPSLDPTAQSNGWQSVGDSKKGNKPQQKPTEGTTLAYIKNVNEKVDARVLREVLEKYGSLKYFDVSRPRVSLRYEAAQLLTNGLQNCAFVEFDDAAGYTAAVTANPHTVGSEQIYVEERRPRPNAYGGSSAAFSGRGASTAGRGRGGMQARSGSQNGSFPKEGGRGGFQRGGKSGTATPKGRGQPQAA